MAGSLRHLPGARRPAGRLVRGQTLAYSPGPGLGVAHWGRRLDCPFPHGRVVAVRVPACSPLPLRGATGRRLPGPGARLDRLDADATARLRPGLVWTFSRLGGAVAPLLYLWLFRACG